MLNQQQLDNIKAFLESSQNPLFFFDNDVDGLCSFIVLRRALERGKGVVIKSFPKLDKSYSKKVTELNPDRVIILDKAEVDEEFINILYQQGIPTLWIDHHNVEIPEQILKKAEYYNTFPSSEPTTYVAHKIFKRKQDTWVAMIGCIGDVYLPEFAEEFARENPELFKQNTTGFDALYTTEVGRAVRMLNFGLKDSTTNVLHLIRLLTEAKSLHDLYEENSRTRQLHRRYKQLEYVYQKNLERAESQINENSKLIFFTYSGESSMSSELSNELKFKHRDKIVAVAYKNHHQEKASVSIRGENVRTILLKVLEKIEGATGGGHEKACGAQVPLDRLDDFERELREGVNKED